MISGSHGPKRFRSESLEEVQARNEAWWDATPMSYDWRGTNQPEPLSRLWFDHQDALFIEASRHFATDRAPFDRLIPFQQLRGKRVLEIGIGSGLHSELLSRAGAEVTGIDITNSAVERTQARFRMKELKGTFLQRDAEDPGPDFVGEFEYVWSWGVVHHSSRTARIVRNVSTWLKPEGRFAGMVYHRDSTMAALAIVKDWIVHRKLLSHSYDEALWRGTDGYTARFYPADQWRDLLLAFFANADVRVTGGLADAVPLPRRVRRSVAERMPGQLRDQILSRIGGFLVFEARVPQDSPRLGQARPSA